jgi:hypothetical protein
MSFVAVDEAHRRKSIGKALVQAALNEVPAGHYVLVEATPDVEPFFEKMGFQKTPVRGALYNDVTIVYGPTEQPPDDEITTDDGLGDEYHDNKITMGDGSRKERVLRFVHMIFRKPSEDNEDSESKNGEDSDNEDDEKSEEIEENKGRAAAIHTVWANISRMWRRRGRA